MSHFYTSVAKRGNRILFRGYKDGKRYSHIYRDFQPRLFLPTDTDSKYRTIYGKPVKERRFKNSSEMYVFLQQFKDVDNFNYYGIEDITYQFIYEKFPKCKHDSKKIKVCYIDIEVDTEGGYPNMDTADKKITAITLMYDDITFALGYGDFMSADSKVKYVKCEHEHDLIRKFLKIWNSGSFSPDVVTGWNCELFDIPYLYSRIARVFDDDVAKQLSPWGMMDSKTIRMFNRDHVAYYPLGIAVLDYINMYKKFVSVVKPQESYRLDHISYVELGEKKLDYSDYGSLHRLALENHQMFMEYNVRDCSLVKRLDDKLKLLDLVYTIAYSSGVNLSSALGTVQQWDASIHAHLMDKCVVVPRKEKPKEDRKPVGAFVKSPLFGRHDWVVSFDLTSMYPMRIIGTNIGPDTVVTKRDLKALVTANSTDDEKAAANLLMSKMTDGGCLIGVDVDTILNGLPTDIAGAIKTIDLSLAANGYLYRKDKQSFLSQLMRQLFDERKIIKKEMLDLKQRKSNGEEGLDDDIERLDTLQYAVKVRLNSVYGALGNQYFRWYDIKYAESITLSGQLTLKWAEKYVNAYMNKLLKTENVDYIIYMDTDSIYVKMENIVEKFDAGTNTIEVLDAFCETKMQPLLNAIFAKLSHVMNSYEQTMIMKREIISDRAVFVAKKRYMLNVHNNEGVQYEKPNTYIKGIDCVRSSTPAACREAIQEAIRIILQGNEKELHDHISEFREKYMSLPLEEIARNSSVNGLNKYSDPQNIYGAKTPMYVRGALLYNHHLKVKKIDTKYENIFDGGKVKYVSLKLPNPIHEDVISWPGGKIPPELDLTDYIDYDTQFTKSFLDPITGILDIVGWTNEPVYKMSSFWS